MDFDSHANLDSYIFVYLYLDTYVDTYLLNIQYSNGHPDSDTDLHPNLYLDHDGNSSSDMDFDPNIYP